MKGLLAWKDLLERKGMFAMKGMFEWKDLLERKGILAMKSLFERKDMFIWKILQKNVGLI